VPTRLADGFGIGNPTFYIKRLTPNNCIPRIPFWNLGLFMFHILTGFLYSIHIKSMEGLVEKGRREKSK
jgi:hypothetical protein